MKVQWDTITEANNRSLMPDFKEVWHYRDLISLFVKRDFVSVYKQTLFGPIWLYIQPLLTTLIYVFIFGNLANLGTDGLPKPLFYLTGIISWTFFSDVFTKSSGVFLSNSHLFTKVYFPRLIVLISIFFSSLLRMGIQFSLLIILTLYLVFFKDFAFQIGWKLLFLPVIIFLIVFIALGLGMLVASLTIKYRDLNNLIQFGVQLLMYATPVVYSMSTMPDKYKQFIKYNPLAPLIEGFRYCCFGVGEFDPISLLYAAFWALLILVVGTIAFRVSESNFVDNI
jgi:lipopolysaccharide transport system permease protein